MVDTKITFELDMEPMVEQLREIAAAFETAADELDDSDELQPKHYIDRGERQ